RAAETTNHLFHECPVTISVWKELSFSELLQGERNKRVHEKANRSGKEIANFIKRYIFELNGIEEKVPNILTGFVKINFDAVYDGNLCQSAMGIVARDSEGNVLLSFIEIYHQVALAFAAEAIACRTATQIGIDMLWSNIIIEGDALSIIKKTANSLAHTLAMETLKKKDEIYLLGRVLEYAEI
ncbi:hypothetical protein Gotri_001585, partial [Gossypium trilobum]|nr:hypothetical protein [Gossypium trilobum]